MLDIQSSSADFIYAYGIIEPSNPSSPNSTFYIHEDYGNFNLNLLQAQKGTHNSTITTPDPEEEFHSGLSLRQKFSHRNLKVANNRSF